MKTVTRYEAEDGRLFITQKDCLAHENKCADISAANDMLQNGATILAALIRANQTQPWWDHGLTAEDLVVLRGITKETGFVVQHWQCRREPGYKPIRINLDGRIELWGNAGSWSGPYGGLVTLADLLRYARESAGGEMNKSQRTNDEILARIAQIKDRDVFGFEGSQLVYFLDYEHAKPFLNDDTTEAAWAEAIDHIKSPSERIADYMAFAWEKANNRRGLSAQRSIDHFSAWLWLDGEDELAESIQQYEYYGKPHLVAICQIYGIDWEQYDDGDWVNSEDGHPRTAAAALEETKIAQYRCSRSPQSR